jgi:uncharacterized protein YcbX
MSSSVGRVSSIMRYPVKSMQGEALDEVWADERGILGDRAHAVIDVETGNVASAKHPRRWAGLLACRAQLSAPPEPSRPLPPVRIALPDGTSVSSDDPKRTDDVLSEYLGRRVSLAASAPPAAHYDDYWPDEEGLSPQGYRDTFTSEPISPMAPPGTFFDLTSFHLITARSLAALRRALPDSQVAAARFRPNLQIDSDDGEPGFVENEWVGRTLRVGEQLALKMLLPSMRCVMTTLAQEALPSDPEILRALVRENRIEIPGVGRYPCIGVYGSLARKLSTGGLIRRGDVCNLV